MQTHEEAPGTGLHETAEVFPVYGLHARQALRTIISHYTVSLVALSQGTRILLLTIEHILGVVFSVFPFSILQFITVTMVCSYTDMS